MSIRPTPPSGQSPSFGGLLVLLSGEGVLRLLSFAAVWLLARRLGPAEYAPVEVALAALMFAALFVELGFPLLAAREIARDHAAESRLARPVLRLQTTAGLLLVALAWTAWATDMLRPELARLLPVYSFSLLLLPLLVPWAFQGRNAMKWVAAPGVVRQGLFLLLSAGFVRGAADLAWLPWAEVAAVGGAGIVAQVAWTRLRQRDRAPALLPPGDAAAPAAWSLLREAAPIGLSQLLWALRMFLATLILWQLVPRESVSNYAVGHRVMMVLQAGLTMYLTNLYPSLSRAARGPRGVLRRLLLQSVAIALGGTLVMALAASANAERILALLYQPAFRNEESAACLRLLVLVIPLLAGRGHARMTLITFGRERLELLCSITGTLLLAGLVPWWTHRDGATGAAMALLAAEAVGMVLTVAGVVFAWRASGPSHRLATGAA